MPLRDTELISVFYKKQCLYNPQMRKGKPYTSTNNPDKNKGNYMKNFKKHKTENNGERYPLTTIEFKRHKNTVHPTQKPVALLEYLIKTYTNENDIVLDFTMGSGSTGVACKNLNRGFIGIELDEEYFKIAESRINDKKEVK